MKKVVLSDGHGMETRGKATPLISELGRSIKENEFNRAVVDILATELKRCGFEVLLAAPTDKDTPLKDRTNLANREKADIYVAIHYNAYDGTFDGPDPSGLSVHIYPGSKEGRRLAQCVHKHLIQGTPQKDRGIVESNFHEVREPKMPAILTENGFMDNKAEALLMLRPEFQKEVAVEHAKGICEYFGVPYVAVVSHKEKGKKAVDALSKLGRLSDPEKWMAQIDTTPDLEWVFIKWLEDTKC